MDKRPELENPKQFLLRKINSQVEVRLKWSQSYIGILLSTDDYFNFYLKDAVEYVGGVLMGNVGEVLIRCNNVEMVVELI